MKIRKKKAALGFVALSLVVSLLINIWAFAAIVVLYFLLTSGIIIFLILNKMLKHTNWWKNRFAFTKQFVSNAGYRGDLHRNYDIANVGSNPARFAFHYDDVRGENWSTGTQGLDMDYEILKFYHSYLREGSYVLLPIVAFSSVSGYLDKEPPKAYLAKFVSILDGLQCYYHPQLHKMKWYMRFPLLYEWKALHYLIKDVEPDKRIEIAEQPMSLMDLEKDAAKWINCWKKEFDIKDLDSILPGHLVEGRKKSIIMMREMISFLKERGYKPVIISPPMSESLTSFFTSDVKEAYIYSFVEAVKGEGVLYLDYTADKEFTKNEYYFNALFMNLRGRKLFTHRVLEDLGLIDDD